MSGNVETEVAYPASWWESRTAEELQEYVRAGFIGGEMFTGAQRELERRGREATQQVNEAARQEILHRADQADRAALIAAALVSVSTLCAVIWFTTR